MQSCPSGGSTEFTELFVRGKEDIKEQKLKVSLPAAGAGSATGQSEQAELQAQLTHRLATGSHRLSNRLSDWLSYKFVVVLVTRPTIFLTTQVGRWPV